MQSSAYYAAKIKAIQTDKNSISSLLSSLNNCSTNIKESTTHTDQLIVCGEKVDKGELNNISGELSTVSSNLNTIINECDEKIAKYQELYEKALEWEREQAARAARK